MRRTCSWYAACVLSWLHFLSPHAVAANKPLNAKLLSPINIVDAVVYAPLGTSQTTTAFFTLKNAGNSDISIVKVTSPQVKKITLVPASIKPLQVKSSEAQKNDPIADTVLDAWKIPAGKTLVLTPGRQYLQLNGLKNSLTTGDELQLEVSLNNGKTLIVLAKVKSAYDQHHAR